jgi:hypothetical protein
LKSKAIDEDALKELSKISQENMEAFNKANDAMKKFDI